MCNNSIDQIAMSKQNGDEVAIACENNAVPTESQAQLVANGLCVIDYSSGHSFRTQDSEDPPQKTGQVFSAIAKASRYGGVGTLRSEETDLIAIGRFGHAGIKLLDQVGSRTKDLKGLQFSEYAVLGPGDNHYESVAELADTMGTTCSPMSDEKGKRVNELLDVLEGRGLLRQPMK